MVNIVVLKYFSVLNNENRTRGLMSNLVQQIAEEEFLKTVLIAGAHDNQVTFFVFCDLNDLADDLAFFNPHFNSYAYGFRNLF